MKLERTITRKNTYILPTRYGVLFVLALLAMLAGSVNYNNNLGFLLVFLLGGMALVSILHTHRNMVGLRLVSASAAPVFAGQPALFDITAAPGAMPRRALVFTLGGQYSTLEDAASGGHSRIRIKVPARQRGMLSAGPLKISTCYPLGLFFAWSSLSCRPTCLVYPRPIYSGTEPLQADDPADALAGQQASGQGVDDFSGLKPYQPGDPVRNISWKAYSRGRGLFVKEFAGRGGRKLMFDYGKTPGRDMEEKLSRLCGAIISAAAADFEYGLILPGKIIEPAKGMGHRHNCLKALALFGKNGGNDE
ncbi:MAG: DUF58 domain-containing protein [Desulfosalsimonas sp.]